MARARITMARGIGLFTMYGIRLITKYRVLRAITIEVLDLGQSSF